MLAMQSTLREWIKSCERSSSIASIDDCGLWDSWLCELVDPNRPETHISHEQIYSRYLSHHTKLMPSIHVQCKYCRTINKCIPLALWNGFCSLLSIDLGHLVWLFRFRFDSNGRRVFSHLRQSVWILFFILFLFLSLRLPLSFRSFIISVLNTSRFKYL